MEAKASEVRTKSVNIKRKKITGHSFKLLYKKIQRGENVKEFEGPHKVYNVCNKNNKGSTRETLATSFKGSKEKRVSYNSHGKGLCSQNATADMELDGSSACKNFRLRDKSAESERNSTIEKIQRKCDMRMKKLIQKQQQETEEFHRVWNEKKLRVEKDNRLEANMIWLIYGESLGSVEKLKMLDCRFKNQMEEDTVSKEAQLKDLKMKQLAARNLERQRADNWLSCCDSDQTASCGDFSQDLLTDEDGGCMNLLAERGSDELQSVEPNKLVPTEVSEIVDHVEPESLSNPSNEGDAILCPDTLMNQRVETDENLLSTEKVLQPLQEASLDQCGLLQMPVPEGQIHASLVIDDPEERDAPVLESNGLQIRDANSERTDETDTVGLLLAEEILRPLQEASSTYGSLPMLVPVQIHASLVTDNPKERDAPVLESGTLQVSNTNSEPADVVVPMHSHDKTQTSKNCEQPSCLSNDASPSSKLHPATDVEGQNNVSGLNLFQTAEAAETLLLANESSQVGVLEIQNNHIDIGSAITDGPEDHIHESLAPADLQCTDALVQGGQGTLKIEVEASERVDMMQCRSELQTVENFVQLRPMSTDVSPSCNPSPASEVEHQNPKSVRNFAPTSQHVEDLSRLHESSPIERDLEIQSRYLDTGSLSRDPLDSGAHMSTPSLNDMAVPQAEVDSEECANQSVLQLGIDEGNVHGSSTLFLHPNHLVNSPFWFVNPLENELKELCKKGEYMERSCEDVMSRLKSDCEKEIQEIVAQVRMKYEMKLKATKEDFQLKISDLREKQKKVFINKVLAFALSSAQIASWPVVQQGMLSASSQQLQQSLQLSQFPLQSSAGQPPPILQVTSPTVHTCQHFAIPHPTGHVVSRNIAAPVQSIQHTAVQTSGNHHLVGQIRPPHWPVFRPAAPSSMYRAGRHAFSQLPHSQPFYPPPVAPQLPAPQSWQVQNPNRRTAMHNPFLVGPSNYNRAPPLPDISSSFDMLDSSYLEALGNVHSGNPDIAAASADVFLIDDD